MKVDRTNLRPLRRALRRGDAKTTQSYLADASVETVDKLKSDYRREVGRDLEYDIRGLSPIPKISTGPGFRINFADGLNGEELSQTLEMLHAPETKENASKLAEVLSAETPDFNSVYSMLWDEGGENRSRISQHYSETTGRSLTADLKPFFKNAVSFHDSQPLPGKAEKRVAVVVSSGNWAKQLSGESQESIGGYHWREIEAYVQEALDNHYTPVFFTPDGLPASPDSFSLLQGQIAPKLGFGMLPGTGPDSEQGKAIVKGLAAPRSLASFKAEDFASLHVAGGHGSHHDLIGHELLEKAALELNEAGKLVTAVCHATPALGSLLEGESATGFSPQYDAALFHAGYVLPEFDPPYNAHQGLRELGAKVSTLKALNIHHTERLEKNGVPVITGTGPEATDNVARQAFTYLENNADRT